MANDTRPVYCRETAEAGSVGAWGVYPHCESRRETGRGYVVRPCDEQGNAEDQFNYGGRQALRMFKLARYANAWAHKLNGGL